MSATTELRERVRAAMRGRRCPTCGHLHAGPSGRSIAAAAGIDHSSVSRFLAGRVSQGGTTDALAAWLDRRSPAVVPV